MGGLLLAQHLQNPLEKPGSAWWKSQGAIFLMGKEQSCSSAIWSPLTLWGALGIAAPSGDTEGRWPCQQPVPQPLLSLQRGARACQGMGF